MLSLKRPDIGDFETGIRKEWLVANGLGGYSSSTVIGCNTRKYHGLLVASLEPPIKRRVLLSKLEEEVEVDGRVYCLSTNEYAGAIHPKGYAFLSSFQLAPFPTFAFELDSVSVMKKVFPIHGVNGVVVSYRIMGPDDSRIKLKARPFITSRGIHEIGTSTEFQTSYGGDHFSSSFNDTFLGAGCFPGRWLPSELSEDEKWYRDFRYRREEERGYLSGEDLYCPGGFFFESRGAADFTVLALGGRREDMAVFNHLFKRDQDHYKSLYEKEKARIEGLLDRLNEKTGRKEEWLDHLVAASDSFIVKRQQPRGKSVIAGYHWFSDFGRDTFISLPGLTLVTGRFDDAREILRTYGEAVHQGLVPNNFSEEGQPNYSGVDATLWFIYAVQKYLEYTGDITFARRLLPTVKAVISGFIKGNSLARADEDGLLSIIKTPKALTWMDVNLDSCHATPRHGKVVEINALWYNALRFISELDEGREYDRLAKKVRRGFGLFWNRDRGCLYDWVHEGVVDDSLRPNQIFAVSLPHSLLEIKRGMAVVERVREELLTPFGLRSLERGNPEYRPRYEGGQKARDLAYHQGTIWSWLLGPFVSAYVKVNNRSLKSKVEAEGFLKPLMPHLSDAGVGSVSEIFDGDPPHLPRGCISQAWSVGEVLRAYYEDILEISPHKRFRGN